jgi:hypothetical protein
MAILFSRQISGGFRLTIRLLLAYLEVKIFAATNYVPHRPRNLAKSESERKGKFKSQRNSLQLTDQPRCS